MSTAGGRVGSMTRSATARRSGNRSTTAPQKLSDPMQLGWIAPTTQGAMVGDYISTSFLAGQQRVVNAFAVGSPPSPDGTLDEPMFSALEKLRGGTNHTGAPPVLFAGNAPEPQTTF